MKCQVNGRGKEHHTMLHVKKKSNNKSPLLSILQSPLKEYYKKSTSASAGPRTLVGVMQKRLAIVRVVVKGKGQHYTIVTNALLGPGSDVSLCGVSLMEKLQVGGCPKEFSFATVNGASDNCLCLLESK